MRCESCVPAFLGLARLPRSFPPVDCVVACPESESHYHFSRGDPVSRILRYPAMTLPLIFASSVAGARAQQPMNAEPQAPGAMVQGPREVVPSLAVPRLVKFGGAFKDEQGKPRTGVVGATFAIYKDQEGGAALWLETQNLELDEQGRYTVLLGSTKSEGLPLELFTSGEPRWLGVQVNLPREMEQPRVLLVSVPYALKAADADTLGGRPLSSFVLTSTAAGGSGGSVLSGNRPIVSQVGGSGTQNFVAKFDATGANVVNSLIFDNGTNVGIGTTSPAAALHVNGDTLLVSSGTTAQVTFEGKESEARFGQDGTGAFFASDTPGKAVRFYTNNGTLNEGLRVTSASNVGIGTAAPTQKLEVAGNLKISGGGSALVFPDGSVMSSAAMGVGGGTITGVNAGTGLSGGGTSGGVTLNNTGVLSFNGRPGMVIPAIGDYSFSQISGAAVTAQLPAASVVRAITYLAGCDSCSVLTNADSQNTIFQNLIGAMTINSVSCFSDAGSPAINVQVNHGGSLSNVLTSNLTCSTSGATSTTLTTSALSVNDILNFTLVADGTAKRVTMVVKATVN